MIKWILFDQAEVQTRSLFRNKQEYEFKGKKFSAELLDSIFYTENYKLFHVGKISEDEFIGSFLKEKNIHLSIIEYKEILLSTITAIEGMPELIANLKRHYKLATLINEGKEWAHYKLDVPDLKKYFDKIIISGEIGIEKPKLEFYKQALTIINANPEECIFIDDKKENCEGAEQLGIKSIVFKDTNQLKQELAKLDITLN